jgi:hypothetical protein
VPEIDDVAVAQLEQFAVELAQQPVEFARRDPQLIVAPVASNVLGWFGISSGWSASIVGES